MNYDIQAAIPHRPPFLLLDGVREMTGDSITVFYTPRADDELWSRIYSGHYPGGAITPGVMLCEMLFQASAVLLHEAGKDDPLPGVPVVTRIQNVKFKNVVLPGTELEITARLSERLSNAFFMKGTVKQGGKVAVQAEFAVAIARPGGEAGA